ncbi:MAG: hypothetical protein CBC48_12030, partial [bacterium TMED88]
MAETAAFDRYHETLKGELILAARQTESDKAEVAELMMARNALTISAQDAEAELRTARNGEVYMTEQKGVADQKAETLVKQLRAVEEQASQLDSQLRDKVTIIAANEAQLALMNLHITDRNTLLNSARTELAATSEENHVLSERASSATHEFASHKAEADSLRLQTEQLRSQHDKEISRREEAAMEGLTADSKATEELISDLTARESAVARALAEESSTHTEIQTQLESEKESLRTLEHAHSTTKVELSAHAEEVESMVETRAQLSGTRVEYDSAKRMINDLRRSLADERDAAEAVNSTNDELKAHSRSEEAVHQRVQSEQQETIVALKTELAELDDHLREVQDESVGFLADADEMGNTLERQIAEVKDSDRLLSEEMRSHAIVSDKLTDLEAHLAAVQEHSRRKGLAIDDARDRLAKSEQEAIDLTQQRQADFQRCAHEIINLRQQLQEAEEGWNREAEKYAHDGLASARRLRDTFIQRRTELQDEYNAIMADQEGPQGTDPDHAEVALAKQDRLISWAMRTKSNHEEEKLELRKLGLFTPQILGLGWTTEFVKNACTILQIEPVDVDARSRDASPAPVDSTARGPVRSMPVFSPSPDHAQLTASSELVSLVESLRDLATRQVESIEMQATAIAGQTEINRAMQAAVSGGGSRKFLPTARNLGGHSIEIISQYSLQLSDKRKHNLLLDYANKIVWSETNYAMLVSIYSEPGTALKNILMPVEYPNDPIPYTLKKALKVVKKKSSQASLSEQVASIKRANDLRRDKARKEKIAAAEQNRGDDTSSDDEEIDLQDNVDEIATTVDQAVEMLGQEGINYRQEGPKSDIYSSDRHFPSKTTGDHEKKAIDPGESKKRQDEIVSLTITDEMFRSGLSSKINVPEIHDFIRRHYPEGNANVLQIDYMWNLFLLQRIWHHPDWALGELLAIAPIKAEHITLTLRRFEIYIDVFCRLGLYHSLNLSTLIDLTEKLVEKETRDISDPDKDAIAALSKEVRGLNVRSSAPNQKNVRIVLRVIQMYRHAIQCATKTLSDGRTVAMMSYLDQAQIDLDAENALRDNIDPEGDHDPPLDDIIEETLAAKASFSASPSQLSGGSHGTATVPVSAMRSEVIRDVWSDNRTSQQDITVLRPDGSSGQTHPPQSNAHLIARINEMENDWKALELKKAQEKHEQDQRHAEERRALAQAAIASQMQNRAIAEEVERLMSLQQTVQTPAASTAQYDPMMMMLMQQNMQNLQRESQNQFAANLIRGLSGATANTNMPSRFDQQHLPTMNIDVGSLVGNASALVALADGSAAPSATPGGPDDPNVVAKMQQANLRQTRRDGAPPTDSNTNPFTSKFGIKEVPQLKGVYISPEEAWRLYAEGTGKDVNDDSAANKFKNGMYFSFSWSDGDWICRCGLHNFGSRTQCFFHACKQEKTEVCIVYRGDRFFDTEGFNKAIAEEKTRPAGKGQSGGKGKKGGGKGKRGRSDQQQAGTPVTTPAAEFTSLDTSAMFASAMSLDTHVPPDGAHIDPSQKDKKDGRFEE